MPTTLTSTPIDSLVTFTTVIEATRAKSLGPIWYRGCGRASFRLIPSLYRHPSITVNSDLLSLEQQLLNRFRQRSIPYLSRPLSDDWDHLFLMQHFGVPTRLLDWTENPYIALYFALTDARVDNSSPPVYTDDAAVWVLDPTAWNRRVLRHINFGGSILSTQDQELKGHAPSTEIGLMNNEPVALYGSHNSARIVAQRGVFTIFGKNNDSMEDIYANVGFPQDSLIKLVAPAAKVATLLEAVTAIGITDSVVFPDMDGLAREIKRFFGYKVI